MIPNQVLQFKIILLSVTPAIWRRIQVPMHYSFWDLHVAIQNAMGWEDRHSHQFQVIDPVNLSEQRIGIPDEVEPDSLLPGWECMIKDYVEKNGEMIYEYDFEDSWLHRIVFEGAHEAQVHQSYPWCLEGQEACPPEDVGGPPGYENFLDIVSDPGDEEYEQWIEWIGGGFNPHEFDPTEVIFDNPQKRWRQVFHEE